MLRRNRTAISSSSRVRNNSRATLRWGRSRTSARNASESIETSGLQQASRAEDVHHLIDPLHVDEVWSQWQRTTYNGPFRLSNVLGCAFMRATDVPGATCWLLWF